MLGSLVLKPIFVEQVLSLSFDPGISGAIEKSSHEFTHIVVYA